MIKFLLFSSLAHLNLVLSSSVMPQYGDIEQKQYDNFMLTSDFHKFLTIPTQETYNSFRSYVRGYYIRSPIDCLNLLDRFRSGRVFKVLFWQALAGPIGFIDPATITLVYYSKVLEWISERIRWALFNYSFSDEIKFKDELETISLMIKLAERSASELKYLRDNDGLISGFDDLVAKWKYLIRNISINFTNKTIDYYSLFRTFNEAKILIKTDLSSKGPSLRLSKCYALLWFYLRHIYLKDCNVIFEIYHHHKAFIVYLVMEFRVRSLGCDINELYPNILRILFEKLYENGSPQFEPILELFSEYNVEYDRNLLEVPEKILNYIELARSFTESSKKYSYTRIWRIKALAELEAYLIQHDRKVDFLTK